MSNQVILSCETFQRLIAHLQTAVQMLREGYKDDEFVGRADQLVDTALHEVENAS
jgi:hypothetical protein